LPHLFEGYLHREKSNSDSSRGMGIGLSVCMSIIKAHDGQMEAENNLDCGVTFRFMIPIKGDGIYG
ncbi:MAG: histidine kinase, partial [Firmicutes bacterium]|nr:histidine kinase [Bacillota bacterium]